MRFLILAAAIGAMLAIPQPALADEGHETGGAKPAKPKPKRPDKEKNCGWDADIELEIDGKRLTIRQMMLKNVMLGEIQDDSGYGIYADPEKLILKVRNPEGTWYVADMTRLGDPNEGCIFYDVGEPHQVDQEPPLF